MNLKHYLTSFVLFLLYASYSPVKAQGCIGGTQNGTLDPMSTTFQLFTTGTAGQYQTFTAFANSEYEFSYCAPEGGSSTYDTEITILDSLDSIHDYNDQFCGIQSHLVWYAPFSGVFRILTTQFQCTSNGTTSTLAYKEVVIVTEIDEQETIDKVLIGPNPTSGPITVTLGDTESEEVEILIKDLLGRVLLIENGTHVNDPYSINFDLSKWTRGVYLLTVKVGAKMRTEKIIVQ